MKPKDPMPEDSMTQRLNAMVLVVSDSISRGESKDESGEVLRNGLVSHGLQVSGLIVVPDDAARIQAAILDSTADLVALTGGTGVAPRDLTPEAVLPLLEKRLEGVEQAIRDYGLAKTPLAMLSRTVVGTRGKQLIMCLPGSPKGVQDALDAVFPAVLHVFQVFDGLRH